MRLSLRRMGSLTQSASTPLTEEACDIRAGVKRCEVTSSSATTASGPAAAAAPPLSWSFSGTERYFQK